MEGSLQINSQENSPQGLSGSPMAVGLCDPDSRVKSSVGSSRIARVSVVVPVYNQAQFLRECLDSLGNQTLNEWEAIVVDDASTQGDPEQIVHDFADPRIRFVRHQQNRGLGAARNTGFRLGQAQLLLSVDADDMLTPTYLQKVGSALLERPNADCAYPDFQLFGARNDVWHNQVCNAATMTRRQWIPGSGTLMRRSLWARIGGYCEAPELLPGNEDWDFWLSAVMDVRPVHVPEALYLYRTHQTSMATRLMYYDFQTREFMYSRHRALFDRYGTGNDFRADGHVNSACAAWQRGERSRAVHLASRAWCLSSRRMHMLKLATKRARRLGGLSHLP